MKKILLSLVVFSLCVFLSSQSAHATATLQLYDGTTTYTIADGSTTPGLVDSSTDAGVVTWIGSIGVFNINITTGITYPALGSSTIPELDLTDVSISGSSGGTLEVWFSQTGFSLSSPATFDTTVGGTHDDTTSFYTYFDTSNTLFGTATTAGTLGPFVAGTNDDPFSGLTSSTYALSSPFSLTSKAVITHSSGGQNTSFNLNLNVVPEPISSTLFIVGGATLGFRRFRKKFIK